MNKQVQHVVALPANLQTSLDPIELGRLEKLGRLELAEQVALAHGLLLALSQLVQDEALEELLVRHANLDGQAGRALLEVPELDERDVLRTARVA